MEGLRYFKALEGEIAKQGDRPITLAMIVGLLEIATAKIFKETSRQIRAVEAQLEARTKSLVTAEERIRKLEDRPSLVYKGTFEQGRVYREGEIITDKGCCWIAKADGVVIRPDFNQQASRSWSLLVKKGADGKAAR